MDWWVYSILIALFFGCWSLGFKQGNKIGFSNGYRRCQNDATFAKLKQAEELDGHW